MISLRKNLGLIILRGIKFEIHFLCLDIFDVIWFDRFGPLIVDFGSSNIIHCIREELNEKRAIVNFNNPDQMTIYLTWLNSFAFILCYFV